MDAYWNDGFPGEVIYGDPIPEDDRGRDNTFIVPKEIADLDEVDHAWSMIQISAHSIDENGDRVFGKDTDRWVGVIRINGMTYQPDQVLFSSRTDATDNARRTAFAIAAMIDRQMWRLGWAPQEQD